MKYVVLRKSKNSSHEEGVAVFDIKDDAREYRDSLDCSMCHYYLVKSITDSDYERMKTSGYNQINWR